MAGESVTVRRAVITGFRSSRLRIQGMRMHGRGATLQAESQVIAPQTSSTDISVARGLLDREDLVERLDRAVVKRVTIVSAPPGSGKTSLLRAWAEREAGCHRVAFVSVERDQPLWDSVLDAIHGPARRI